jgi:hypothetical protein
MKPFNISDFSPQDIYGALREFSGTEPPCPPLPERTLEQREETRDWLLERILLSALPECRSLHSSHKWVRNGDEGEDYCWNCDLERSSLGSA